MAMVRNAYKNKYRRCLKEKKAILKKLIEFQKIMNNLLHSRPNESYDCGWNDGINKVIDNFELGVFEKELKEVSV